LSQATLKVLRPRHYDWELRKGELQALSDLEVALVHGLVVVRPPAWSLPAVGVLGPDGAGLLSDLNGTHLDHRRQARNLHRHEGEAVPRLLPIQGPNPIRLGCGRQIAGRTTVVARPCWAAAQRTDQFLNGRAPQPSVLLGGPLATRAHLPQDRMPTAACRRRPPDP
jgi:hypothetical protein